MKTSQRRSLKPLLALGVVSIILCTPMASLSWGPGGHMMVAQIAFGRLNSHAKAEVTKLLAVKIAPTAATAKSKDFVNAAHWADDLRDFPEFDSFLALHFIDKPFADVEGTDLPDIPANNIIKALQANVKTLQNSTNEQKRAQALRFIIHFVGDIHQPLHCATRVSKNDPDGDHGGNFVFIKVPGRPDKVKLHSYWDGGLDSFPRTGPHFAPPPLSSIPQAAAKATSQNPATDPKIKLNEPMAFQAWANESFDLAQTFVYKNIDNGSTADTNYINHGRDVARQRVAWAGYRLAALLNSIWP